MNDDYFAGVDFSHSGWRLMLHGFCSEALNSFERLVASEPDDPTGHAGRVAVLSTGPAPFAAPAGSQRPACESARSFEFRAEIDCMGREFLGALEASDLGLTLWPGSVGLLVAKANALNGLHEFEQAIEACEKGLSTAPRHPGLLLAKATAHSGLGQPEKALEACERGLASAPEDIGLLLAKAGAHFALHQPDMALEACERGLDAERREAGLRVERDAKLTELVMLSTRIPTKRPATAAPIAAQGGFLHAKAGERLARLVASRPDEALALVRRKVATGRWREMLLLCKAKAHLLLNQPEEALETCETGLELPPGDFRLWCTKGCILARLPDPPARSEVTALRCLARSVGLAGSTELTRLAPLVADTLLEHVEAPLLLWRLLPMTHQAGTLLAHGDRLRAIENSLGSMPALLEWLNSAACDLPAPQRRLLLSRLQLRFGDAAAALETLDELDAGRCSLTAQLYLVWSMTECLEDASAAIERGAFMARNALRVPSLTARRAFDAGHLLRLAGDLKSAASAFERGLSAAAAADDPSDASLLLPNLAMAWWCRRQLAEPEARAHLEAWLAEELRRADRDDEGLLLPGGPPLKDPRTPEGRQALERLFHEFECRSAVEAVLEEKDLLHSAAHRALADRLHNGFADELIERAKHRLEWGELLSTHGWYTEWRREADERWSREERQRLAPALVWIGADDATGDALAATIGDRVHAWSPMPDTPSLHDAVRLHFFERRLDAASTVLLALYIHARAAEHARQVRFPCAGTAEQVLARLIGGAIVRLGVERAIAAFAGWPVLVNAGDSLAAAVDAWMADRRRASAPFPRFARFRKEIVARTERAGRAGRGPSTGCGWS